MGNLKILLAAAVMSISISVWAKPLNGPVAVKPSLSKEIGLMLKKSKLVVEHDFQATVTFFLNQEGKVEIRSVKSENVEVNEFLAKRLDNKKLSSKRWIKDKLYALPVRVRAKR